MVAETLRYCLPSTGDSSSVDVLPKKDSAVGTDVRALLTRSTSGRPASSSGALSRLIARPTPCSRRRVVVQLCN